jgi:hypothetical protein
MAFLTVRNNFTGQSATINTDTPLTASRIKSLRRKLHAGDCMSGDDLGGRGPQDDPDHYHATLARAQSIVCTGRDER